MSKPLPPSIAIRKVPAESVPFGDSISLNGRTVWAAFDSDALVCLGATSAECRTKLRKILRERWREEYAKQHPELKMPDKTVKNLDA